MTLRKLGPSLRFALSLTVWSPAVTAVLVPLATGGVLVSCADEDDPKTWVDRLKDPTQRTQAITKLGEFYQKALNKAGGKRDDPAYVALLNVIVEPLTKTYETLYENSDDPGGNRQKLLEKLQDMRDPRTTSAFVKAISKYEQGGKDEEASIAIAGTQTLAKAGKITDATLPDALWTLFEGYKASKQQGRTFLRDVNATIREVAKATLALNPYGDKALKMIQKEITLNADGGVANQNEFLDQIFWQTTAAQVLGDIKGGSDAARPKVARALVIAMLAPAKGDNPEFTNPVKSALTKIPAQAEDVLIAAIKLSDPELRKVVEYTQKDKDGKPALYAADETENGPDGKPKLGKDGKPIVHHKGEPKIDQGTTADNIQTLALELAAISRAKGRDALLDILPTLDNAQARAAVAAGLLNMPMPDEKSARAVSDAFKDTFKKLDKDKATKAKLLRSAARLYDPRIVDFIFEQLKAMAAEKPEAEQGDTPEKKLGWKVGKEKSDAELKATAADTVARLANESQLSGLSDVVKQTIAALSTFGEDYKKLDDDAFAKNLKERYPDFKDLVTKYVSDAKAIPGDSKDKGYIEGKKKLDDKFTADVKALKKPKADEILKLAKDKTKSDQDAEESQGKALALATNSVKAVTDTLTACHTDVACYLKMLDEKVPGSPPGANMRMVKAITEAAILGGGANAKATRDALVAHLEGMNDSLAREALVNAVDHLCPEGDTDIADKFEAIVAKDVDKGDASLLAADNNVAQVALRLRGRKEK